jgi:hypothetical protein
VKRISQAVSGQKRVVSAAKSTAAQAKPTNVVQCAKPTPELVLDPCCQEFPPMEHDDFKSLKESIRRKGRNSPLSTILA